MCFEAERGERDLQACSEHLMGVTFLRHFVMGTQLQQIPGNLIPEIKVEELKQQYLPRAPDFQFRGRSEPP